MAKVKINERVIRTVESITLNLSIEEALVILDLCGSISGSATNTIREISGDIYDDLLNIFNYDMVKNRRWTTGTTANQNCLGQIKEMANNFKKNYEKQST